jgi:hypothetical protein
MKRRRFIEDQIIGILKEHEAGVSDAGSYTGGQPAKLRASHRCPANAPALMSICLRAELQDRRE